MLTCRLSYTSREHPTHEHPTHTTFPCDPMDLELTPREGTSQPDLHTLHSTLHTHTLSPPDPSLMLLSGSVLNSRSCVPHSSVSVRKQPQLLTPLSLSKSQDPSAISTTMCPVADNPSNLPCPNLTRAACLLTMRPKLSSRLQSRLSKLGGVSGSQVSSQAYMTAPARA